MAVVAPIEVSDIEFGSDSVVELTGLSGLTQGRICKVDASEELRNRLEGLGICIGRTLRLIRKGDPYIVGVYDTRVGLSPEIASHVHVTPLDT